MKDILRIAANTITGTMCQGEGDDADKIYFVDSYGNREYVGDDNMALINAAFEIEKVEGPLRELRKERDRLLTEVDYITLRAYSQGTSVPAEWAAYQQALRDITNTYTSLDDVVWPTKPE